MTEYKLSGWPDLPDEFKRTAYQRMLHEMSLRHATVTQLAYSSGLARGQVRRLLKRLIALGFAEKRHCDTWPVLWQQCQAWWYRHSLRTRPRVKR